MKANLKGNRGIKGLLLLHGEKLLIAVVAIGAGLLVYRALGVERLTDEYQAGKLLDKVDQTKKSIVDPANSFNRAIQEHPDKVRLVLTVDKKGESIDVPPDYTTSLPGVNQPVIVQSTPRTDPNFLPAVGVYGHSGVGLLAFLDQSAQDREVLKQAREVAEKEKEAARKAKEEQEFNNPNRRGGRANRRGRVEDASRGFADPEHPTRRNVEVGGHAGGVQLTGGELVELSRWVSVVAKVPVRAQFNLYRSTFEKARGGYDPSIEFPEYLGYLVQRAEVVPGQAALNWQDIPVHDARSTRKQLFKAMVPNAVKKLEDLAATEWAGNLQGDVVDPIYLDPKPNQALVYPLPPLVGRDWGADATHPDIPLAKDSALDERGIVPAEAAIPTTPVEGDEAGFGVTGESMFGGRERDRRSYQRGMERGRESLGRDNYRPLMRDRGNAGIFSGEGAGRGSPGSQIPLQANVNEWLLRFYDFTVAPGKKYTYRVQLMLRDPNVTDHVTPSMLDPAVNDRIKKLPKGPDGRPLPLHTVQLTAWSEPSPPVGIPLDGSVRVEEIRAASGMQLGDEPHVKLLVQAFGKESKSGQWIEASLEKEFTRGGVANFQENAEYIVANGTQIDKADSFPFHTGITVLDMRGGERLGKDVLAPSRVLLMDPAGGLSVRNETDDAREVMVHRDIFVKKKTVPGDNQRADPIRRSPN